MGVVDRGMGGDGADMGAEGTVDICPEVVYGVKSRNSGKMTRHEFFPA